LQDDWPNLSVYTQENSSYAVNFARPLLENQTNFVLLLVKNTDSPHQ
jgi:hypothetical protein